MCYPLTRWIWRRLRRFCLRSSRIGLGPIQHAPVGGSDPLLRDPTNREYLRVVALLPSGNPDCRVVVAWRGMARVGECGGCRLYRHPLRSSHKPAKRGNSDAHTASQRLHCRRVSRISIHASCRRVWRPARVWRNRCGCGRPHLSRSQQDTVSHPRRWNARSNLGAARRMDSHFVQRQVPWR
jgi:hypothetical protein